MSDSVGRRCSLDPPLLWLWCRPAAVAPILPLAWELPYAAGAALKRKKRRRRRRSRGRGRGRGRRRERKKEKRKKKVLLTIM